MELFEKYLSVAVEDIALELRGAIVLSLGRSSEVPTLEPAYIEDKNGHILPYVKFTGGKLELFPDALTILGKIENARR